MGLQCNTTYIIIKQQVQPVIVLVVNIFHINPRIIALLNELNLLQYYYTTQAQEIIGGNSDSKLRIAQMHKGNNLA